MPANGRWDLIRRLKVKLIEVHLLVSELYIYQNARCNDKNYICYNSPSLSIVRHTWAYYVLDCVLTFSTQNLVHCTAQTLPQCRSLSPAADLNTKMTLNYINSLRSYRTVNTLRLVYKNQSVNAVLVSNWCLLGFKLSPCSECCMLSSG